MKESTSDGAEQSLFNHVERRAIDSALLAWFRRYQRDLPWRHDRDPYRIWVSEVMLQQTQVATVVGYFDRFLKRFPSVQALAQVSEHEVLRAWEGLGYYRRARHLHRAARMLMDEYGGSVPDDPVAFAALPGVGRYMVGAVLSQAFDRRLPILEANSERVLCRLLGERGDVRSTAVRRRLWRAAEELLPRRHVGDFNQALMELGALVCTPAKPECEACPLRKVCVARRLELQGSIPHRSSAPATQREQEVGIVLRREQHVLLVQRPECGRWSAMWEFPHGTLIRRETHEEASHRVLAELTGLRARLGEEIITVRHAVNHHHITLVCFEAHHRGGRFRSDFYQQAAWAGLADLRQYPFSAPQRRVAEALIGSRQRPLF